MKIDVAAVLDVSAKDDVAAWGMTESGNPCLLLVIGGRRVTLECGIIEARDIGCGGIVAADACNRLRAEREAEAARRRALT